MAPEATCQGARPGDAPNSRNRPRRRPSLTEMSGNEEECRFRSANTHRRAPGWMEHSGSFGGRSMSGVRNRNLLAVLIAVAVVLFSAGAAAAVSGAGYSPEQLDCPYDAASNSAPSNPNATSPGCHNVA